MKRLALLLLVLPCALWLRGGNRIFTPDVRSLTSIVNSDWLNRPVMTLGTGDRLVVGFDELSHNYRRFTYHITRCEWDWQESDALFESDWLEGFNDNPIEDYQNSLNTTVSYTHYTFTIPNDRCRLKLSGNYRLTVYDADDADEAVLQVDFYVVEQLMALGLGATANTDVDHNDRHQQLSMTVGYNSLPVTNPDEQLHTVVMQNWCDATAVADARPNYVNSRGLGWEHNRQFIFPAGNEYHKYEILDVSHPTMGLDRMEWDGSQYQAWPFAATVRRNYLTDVDADGAFRIRNSDNTEVDYTCEYVWVNYELQCPYQGDVYIDGHWTTDADRQHYLMAYDDERRVYTAQLLQKQGYYSYQFVGADGLTAPSEGCFYQTENRYQAFVYYKSPSDRSWRLVAYRGVKTE